MENVIQSLPSRVSPTAMAAGAVTALRTDRLHFGADLFKTFTEDDATKVNLLRKLAAGNGYSFKEFDEDIQQAVKLAKEHDTLMGFVAKDGAKGREKYGPKQSSMVQRSSEARQVFGVLLMAGEEYLRDLGYFAAVDKARSYLNEKAVNWRGESKPTEEARAIKQTQRAAKEALQEAQEENPMEPGETMATYAARLAKVADEQMETKQQEQFRKDVAAVVGKMIQNNTVAFVDAVALEILRQSSKTSLLQHIATLQAWADADKGEAPF